MEHVPTIDVSYKQTLTRDIGDGYHARNIGHRISHSRNLENVRVLPDHVPRQKTA